MRIRTLISILLLLHVGCSYFTFDCLKYTDNDKETHFCELHKLYFETKLIRIHYGLYRDRMYFPQEYRRKVHFDSLYRRAQPDTFKYAWLPHFARGGCVQGSQTFARIYYCRQCNDNLLKWLEKNASTRPSKGYFPQGSLSVTTCVQCTQRQRDSSRRRMNGNNPDLPICK